jgi:hypothetical protein
MLPSGSNQKSRIMEYLVERATNPAARPACRGSREARYKGWVGANVTDLAKGLGLPPHDVTHALYDLRTQGLVQFRESKSTGAARRAGVEARGGTPRGGVPVRLRVTTEGMKWAKQEPAPEPVESAPVDESERFMEVTEPTDSVAVETPALDEEDSLMAGPESQPESQPEPDDERVARLLRLEALLGEQPLPDSNVDLRDLGVDPEDYPLVDKLMKRDRYLLGAAHLLDRAGEDALMDMAIGQRESVTREQREFVALLTALWKRFAA